MILLEIENKKLSLPRTARHATYYLLAALCARTAVKAAEISKSPGPSAAVISLIIECGENRSGIGLATYT
jgi:hypothetical protein